MDCGKRTLSREARDEVVAEVGVERITNAETVEVTEGCVFGGAAVGVDGFEGPLNADVAVFGE
jgi:hypothetical protein